MVYENVHCTRPPLGPGEIRLAAEVHALASRQSGLASDDPIFMELAEAAIALLQSGVRDTEILADTLLWLSICKQEDRDEEV